jgi:dTDP-4-dehydrorhamnose 3,5-epimerase
MPWIPQDIDGVWIFEPRIWRDDRGYFYESFNANTLPESLQHIRFVQDNEAQSTYGVLRGLHYQLPPYAQAKLVRCTVGKVLDVIVDIRPDSETYGQARSFILDDETKVQLYVPHGFAHGYVVLSETAIFSYKCDQYYHPLSEGGLRYNDPHLSIDWQVALSSLKISDKDLILPFLGDHEPFPAEKIY